MRLAIAGVAKPQSRHTELEVQADRLAAGCNKPCNMLPALARGCAKTSRQRQYDEGLRCRNMIIIGKLIQLCSQHSVAREIKRNYGFFNKIESGWQWFGRIRHID